jgi:lipopolysaccharide biosynthesis glycosyltransferase
LGIVNGGLQVVNPSTAVYNLILTQLSNPSGVGDYEFADQSLLSDLFKNRWVALPYVYNALKTLRWPGVHADIWVDDSVKNIHYILNPKPWDKREEGQDEIHDWWWSANDLRLAEEKARGIAVDGF